MPPDRASLPDRPEPQGDRLPVIARKLINAVPMRWPREGESMGEYATYMLDLLVQRNMAVTIATHQGAVAASAAVVTAWDAYLRDTDDEDDTTWCALRDAIDALREGQ